MILMPGLFISIILSLIVLYVAEVILVGKLNHQPELSRKLVHLAHGLAAATWPFFVQYKTIIYVELIFLGCVIIARRARIFKGLEAVKRKTCGEMFFPLGIIAVALMNPNKWIFAAAILHLALADSAAALVGTNGRRHEYYIFGHRKTVEGSTAFWLVSLVIMIVLLSLAPLSFSSSLGLLLLLPVVATFLENTGVFGIDNFIVPVVVAFVLMQVQL